MSCTLITGITGGIGKALLSKMVEPFVAFARNDSRFLKADITDKRSIFKHAKNLKGKVKTIIHMASPGYQAPQKLLYNTIFEGTKNMLEFAKEIDCHRFFYSSSILAKTKSYYGQMKLKVEELLNDSAQDYGVNFINFRLGNVYGKNKLSFIKVVLDIFENNDKILYHRIKRSSVWLPVYIQDVIDCVMMFLDSPFKNRTYDLIGPEVPRLKEIFDLIAHYTDTSFNTKLNLFEKTHLFVRKVIDKIKGSYCDITYSTKELCDDYGFLAKVGLKEGIFLTLKKKKNIVVCLNLLRSQSISLQRRLLDFLKINNLTDYNIKIKPHPWSKNFCLKKEFSKYKNCEFVDTSMEELLKDCFLLITISGSVLFESVFSGIKTMCFIPEEPSTDLEYWLKEDLIKVYSDDFSQKVQNCLAT